MLGLLKNYNSSFASELIRQSKVAVGPYTQNVVYIPYGEVFVEERNGSWTSPYLFNAKELDEETGLYYYGARYLNPSIALWLSTDPSQEKYPDMSPYNYCAGNPVKLVDPDGDEPKGLRIILQFSDDPDIRDAANTRINEIKSQYPNDKLVHIKFCHLDKLKGRIESEIASKEGYKKTKEFSVFSHNGPDGPIYDFSNGYNGNLRLSTQTGNNMDIKQMTIEGWKDINYNFDPQNSIAAFYGCNSASFAEKFLKNTNVQSAAGNSGGSSNVKGEFDGTWTNVLRKIVILFI